MTDPIPLPWPGFALGPPPFPLITLDGVAICQVTLLTGGVRASIEGPTKRSHRAAVLAWNRAVERARQEHLTPTGLT